MALAKRSFSVAAAATGVVYVGAGGMFEVHVAEATAVAAATTMRLYDQAAGPVATSPIAEIRLAADGRRQFQFAKGLKFRLGLLVEAVGGDVQGALSIGGSGALKPWFFNADTVPLITGAVVVDSMLIAEGAGAAASAVIYDGLAIAGAPFVTVPLAANETVQGLWPQGVQLGTGVTVDISGAVAGVIYTL